MVASNIVKTAIDTYRRRGLSYVVKKSPKFASSLATNPILCRYYKKYASNRTFQFRGKNYSYFYDLYEQTWRTERLVEIPIVWEVVKASQINNNRILEVGNVLSHRYPIGHDVVDKYEVIGSVINQDIVEFNPSKRYDLIVSISTMEHVGWD